MDERVFNHGNAGNIPRHLGGDDRHVGLDIRVVRRDEETPVGIIVGAKVQAITGGTEQDERQDKAAAAARRQNLAGMGDARRVGARPLGNVSLAQFHLLGRVGTRRVELLLDDVVVVVFTHRLLPTKRNFTELFGQRDLT